MADSERDGKGLAAFALIWATQIVSTLASGMSAFALSIWLYERTRSATMMAVIQVSYIAPFLVTSFFAGPLIDRKSRKLMMAMSDMTAVLGTAGVMIAFLGGVPAPWMLCVAAVLNGVGNAFQWPAFTAVMSTMVPKRHLGRANGLMALMDAGPGVAAPILAGALLPALGIGGILALDLGTFVLAAGTILLSRIPKPVPTEEGQAKRGNIVADAVFGFRYIFERRSLLHLQLFFLVGNLLSGMAYVLVVPMVLARNAMDPAALASVRSAGAIGGVLGGLLMTAWGGFRKKTLGVFLGWVATALFGLIAFGAALPLAAVVGLSVASAAVVPIMNGSNQTIWQSKVAPDLQGRVFSARRLIAWITTPVAPLLGGLLADTVFEPLLSDGGTAIAGLLMPIFGVGPGAGTGLLISTCGLLLLGICLFFWSMPELRDVETLIPDYQPHVEPAAPVD
jgi:hypothetical protein